MSESAKYIEDVITKEEIDKNYVSFLISGVGSGKSSFCKKLPHTLFLTPRTLAKDEILTDEEIFCSYLSLRGNVWLSFDEWQAFVWEDFYYISPEREEELKKLQSTNMTFNKSVCKTYTGFSKWLRSHTQYIAKHGYDFLFGYFDYIIIDEVQVLGCETDFALNNIDIYNMLTYLIEKEDEHIIWDKHIILLSATPDPVKSLFRNKSIKYFNLMEETNHVLPTNVFFIEQAELMPYMQILYEDSIDFIYFYNGPIKLPYYFTLGQDVIPSEEVLSLFSKHNKIRGKLATSRYKSDQNALADTIQVENTLAKNGYISNKFKVILSTSTLNMAISINNKNIEIVFIDSHIASTVIQCMGRLRKADFELCIVMDSENQYKEKYENDLELYKEVKEEIEDYNNALKQLESDEERIYYINNVIPVLDTDKPIAYDYIKQKFIFNHLAEYSTNYKLNELAIWDSINKDKHNPYKSLIKSWFKPDDVEISDFDTMRYRALKIMQSKKMIRKDTVISGPYKEETIEKLLDEFAEIYYYEPRHQRDWYIKRILPEYHFVTCRDVKHKGMIKIEKRK